LTLRVDIATRPDLPRQAWVAHVDGNAAFAIGSNVRVFDDGLYEGTWARTRHPGDLRGDGIYLGSGAVWKDGVLTLITASHTFEAIYIARSKGRTWASNSLAATIAAASPDGFAVESIRRGIRSSCLGVEDYKREIHHDGDFRLYRFMNAFVQIAPDGGLSEIRQEQASRFSSYSEYRQFLLAVLGEAAAAYGTRDFTVYLSRGYDSPAVAALAGEAGPTIAISQDRGFDDLPDDGVEIARALGIPCTVLPKKARAVRPTQFYRYEVGVETISPAEYEEVFEFFCGSHLMDEFMKAPAELLQDRVVLTGLNGDKMWSFDPAPSNRLELTDRSGCGLTEFRLRVGFAHVPVPVLAFNQSDGFRMIGNSEAMKPWRLFPGEAGPTTRRGVPYDRPIPRRIAEEAGVPRHLFGQHKLFAGAVIGNVHKIARALFDLQTARYVTALASWPHRRLPPAIRSPSQEHRASRGGS
jgi:hypothetical protein